MAKSDCLAIGARAIARDVFNDALTDKQIYRLAERGGWPFIKIGHKLAMRPAAGRAEIERREALARTAPEKRHGRSSP